MPATPFYNENRNRAFPFLAGGVGGTGQLPLDAIVDAGFVIGPEAVFDVLAHGVYLASVTRAGDVFYFRFASDCPTLYDRDLVFTRHLADPLYTFEDLDSEGVYGSVSNSDFVMSYSLSDSLWDIEFDTCPTALWSGYLVTGDLAALGDLIPAGSTWTRAAGDARLEPALLYNQSGSLVASLNLANNDRTRATGPEDCEDPTWPYETGGVFIAATCLQGDLYFRPGYNCLLTQNTADNSLTITAARGAGEGEPCDPPELFPGEWLASGGGAGYDGGVTCNEGLRTINGLGGPAVQLLAGNGVSILPDPLNHRIVIDVNMRNMAVCEA